MSKCQYCISQELFSGFSSFLDRIGGFKLRILITFVFSGVLDVPVHHESLIHGLIYHSIRDPVYRDVLHNQGFTYEKRQFRMFCFSRLQGQHTLVNKRMLFHSPVSFLFTAWDEQLIRELTSALFTKESVLIGSKPMRLQSIQQVDEHTSGHMRIRMITPVTAYSTITLNNKRKTFFYSPREEEFSMLVRDNAVKKYATLYGKEPVNADLHLKPVDFERLRPHVVMFKNTYIKGWTGDFFLKGSPELVQLVYDVGLSAKNSNGLGLFKVVQHIEERDQT